MSSDTRRDSASASFSSRSARSSAIRSSIAAAVSPMVEQCRVSRSLAAAPPPSPGARRCRSRRAAPAPARSTASPSASRLASASAATLSGITAAIASRAWLGRLVGRFAHPHQSLDQLRPGLLRPAAPPRRRPRRPPRRARAASPRPRRCPRASWRAGRRAPRAGGRCWLRSRRCCRRRARRRPASPPSSPPPPAADAAVRSAWFSIPAMAGGISSRSCAVTSASAAASSCARAVSAPDWAWPCSISRCSACGGVAQRRPSSRSSRAFCSSPLSPIAANWPSSSSSCARDAGDQGAAGRVLAGEPAGEHLDLAAGHVEPLGERRASPPRRPARRRPGSARSSPASPGPAPRARRAPGRPIRRPRAIAPSTAASICAAASSIRSAAAPAPLSIRATWAPSRCAAPPATSSASRPARGERRELAFERAGLLMRGEAGLLHRLGGGARLLLGLGQVADQHADIDPRRFGRRVSSACALRSSSARLAGEVMGDPAEPVGGFVAEAHQPRRFLARAPRDCPRAAPRRWRARSRAPGSRARIAVTAR